MLHNDDGFHAATERAVGEAEAITDAEIIVVASSRSGSYRDLAFGAAFVLTEGALAFLLFSPWSFSPVFIPVDLLIVAALASWVIDRSPALLTRLATRKRKERQVASSAAAAFHEEAVDGTRGRTGVLVYVSALEDRVVVLPDAGILAKVPQGELNTIRWGEKADPAAPGDLAHFLAGLASLGQVLARHLPALHGNNPDEVSNAPRIRA
jgi:putative membrane protein